MAETATTNAAAEQPTAQETTTVTADQLATQAGFDNAKSYIEALQSQVASTSIATADAGKAAAANFVSSLLKLVLMQESFADYNLEKYDWINLFDDEKIEYGNGKEYIKMIATGIDTYDQNAFNPTKAVVPRVANRLIRLYDDNGDLAPYAFQALKPLTILENKWLPFFMSGKLQQFIGENVELMRKSLFFYKYTAAQSLISDLIAMAKVGHNRYTGKKTELMDAFIYEIFPLIEDMQYFNKKYAISSEVNNSYMTASKKSNLLMIMNRNTLNRFKNGMLANQLFSKLVDFNDVLPPDNIIGTGKNFTVGDSDTVINVSDEELIAENQILIIDKNAIKYLWYIDTADVQKYITNLSIQHVYHLWGVFGILPWCHAILYENDALTGSTPAATTQPTTTA